MNDDLKYDHASIRSPANSTASSDYSFQHPEESTTSSQHSSSPELECDYFSDFNVNCDFDSKIFDTENDLWLPKSQHFSFDLDLDQSLGDDDILKPHGNAAVGGSVSMFSLVLMMSFSFITGIFSVGSLSGAGSSSLTFLDTNKFGSIFVKQPWPVFPTHSTVPNTGSDYSYGLLPVRESLGEAEEVVGTASDSVPTHTGNVLPAGGGRVLLSLPSTDEKILKDSFEYQSHSKHHVDSIESKYPSAYSRPAASLSALWRKQNYDFVGTIYPPPRISDSEQDLNQTSAKISKEKKHLRFRSMEERLNNTAVRLSPISRGTKEKHSVESHAVSMDIDKDKVVILY
jgi:hypothetical protein